MRMGKFMRVGDIEIPGGPSVTAVLL